MDQKIIEQIVARVLQQLERQVLVVLSPARDYEQAIYQRIIRYDNVSFSVYATEAIFATPALDKWEQVGTILTRASLCSSQLSQYQAIFLPFLEMKTVGEVTNGLLVSEESELIHQALSQNIPVMALNYYCNPESELNQILGLNKNKQYNNVINENINKAISLGIQIGSLNEIEMHFSLNNVSFNKNAKPTQSKVSRYITLKEVMNNPGGYSTNSNQLTDSAIDYLKSLKK